MTKERASIFAGDEALDVSRRSRGRARRKLRSARGRTWARSRGFPLPNPRAKPAVEPPTRRPPRIHRAGRTMQFNARTTPQTVEALYAIADQEDWLVCETLERALAALQRELAGQGA